MPLYDYECRRCGPFRDWRPMSRSDRAAPCPSCGRAARRAVSAPRLGMDGRMRRAHAINEKSAHEPRVVRRRRGDALSHDAGADLASARRGAAGHHHGHGHDHGHGGGGRVQRSNHPWMIRH